jgi:hypothetical protein
MMPDAKTQLRSDEESGRGGREIDILFFTCSSIFEPHI